MHGRVSTDRRLGVFLPVATAYQADLLARVLVWLGLRLDLGLGSGMGIGLAFCSS